MAGPADRGRRYQVRCSALGYADPDVAALGRRSPEPADHLLRARAAARSRPTRSTPSAAVVPPGGYLPDSVLRRHSTARHGCCSPTATRPSGAHRLAHARPGSRSCSVTPAPQSGGPGPSDAADRARHPPADRLRGGAAGDGRVEGTAGRDPSRRLGPGPRTGGRPTCSVASTSRGCSSWACRPRRPRHPGTPTSPTRRASAGPRSARAWSGPRAGPWSRPRCTPTRSPSRSAPSTATPGSPCSRRRTTPANNRLGAVLDAERLRRDISDSLRGIRVVVGSAVRHHVRRLGQLRGDPGQRPRPAGAGRAPRPHQQPAAHDRLARDGHAACRSSARRCGCERPRPASASARSPWSRSPKKGDEVGTPISFSVRSSQVGILIWAIMGAGMALLVVMIVRRWVKRGLGRRSTAAVIEP